MDNKQKSTFTKWINGQFSKVNRSERLESLKEDLHTGVLLIQLLQVLLPDIKCRNPKLDPKNQVQCLDNLSLAFDMLQKAGLKLVGVGPNDIYTKNEKLICGLVWQIIYAIQIGGIKGDDSKKSGKDGLLLWCQKMTKGYEGVEVKDFTNSWKSGLAIAALIHKSRPELIDFEEVRKEKAEDIIRKCFTIAEQSLNIVQLLEVDDMASVPDDKQIMTYISEFFHCFTQKQTTEVSVRRVARFASTLKATDDMVEEFENAAQGLRKWISNELERVKTEDTSEGDICEWKKRMDRANTFRYADKREQSTKLADLELILGNINTCNKSNNRPLYTPPEELALANIRKVWDDLEKAEIAFLGAVKEKFRTCKETTIAQYNQYAQEVQKLLSEVQSNVTGLSGSVKEQSEALAKLKKQFEEQESGGVISKAQNISMKLGDAGIPTNEFELPWEDLSWEYQNLKSVVNKKASFVDAQAALEKQGGVSAEKLEEYKETFQVFDKDNSDSLVLEEFTNCLKGLGVGASEEEIKATFTKYAKKGEVSFDSFIKFMTELTSDTQTYDQVLQSFVEVAKNDTYITEKQLKDGMGPEAAYLMSTMKSTPQGYDFKEFVGRVYGKK